MNWGQIFAICSLNIVLALATSGFVLWVVCKLHRDISYLADRMDVHARHIHELYQMFVDLLTKSK